MPTLLDTKEIREDETPAVAPKTCSHLRCSEPSEDTFMGLPVCWLHRLVSRTWNH